MDLPGPVVPEQTPMSALLTGPRSTSFTFDLLGLGRASDGSRLNEALIGAVPVAAGSVAWESWSAIKGGGSIEVVDIGQSIDWLNVRVRPMARIESVQSSDAITVPLGVFIPAAPVETWTAQGRTWKVELLDKNSILDQDIATSAVSGRAITYALAKGTNVLATVKAIIAGVGESSPAIGTSTTVLGSPMSWDMGTTRLRIINDLLDAGGYCSLWCDGWGNYRTAPYVEQKNRVPIYTTINPFVVGPTSVMSPDWLLDRDIYGVPNRMVVVGEGDGRAGGEALTVVVENTDPASPFSYQARGRWITVVDTGVAAVNEAALLGYAKRRMTNLTATSSNITLKHLFLPELLVESVVRYKNGRAGADMLCVVRKTTVAFDSLGLAVSEIREVLM